MRPSTSEHGAPSGRIPAQAARPGGTHMDLAAPAPRIPDRLGRRE